MGLTAERITVALSAALIMLAAIQGIVVVGKVFDHAAREGVEDGEVSND